MPQGVIYDTMSTMTFELRPATPDDSQAIEVVRITTWRVAYHGIMPDSYLDALDVRPAVVRRRAEGIATGVTAGVVALRDGRLRGFSLYGASRDEGIDGMEVYAIYVLPDEFSTGMGRALMTESVDRVRESGHTEVGLWVLADNARARRFYERSGFTLSGRTKDLPDPPLKEVHYRMALGETG
ncbi:GNAT family N-acetyltransferase [Nonomuraea phyllanthi]|uniref:GNAT family N-acetyltransferase n=2 Tax=Nonomuraea phyllanthi TaxID=2219224 RepID=A0A5C4WIA4_9ACTN|nr:GNAT family N-acetyltransferase [Nonomuraea phyllanthi]